MHNRRVFFIYNCIRYTEDTLYMRIRERDREGNSQEKHKAVDSRATLFPVASWRGACASARLRAPSQCSVTVTTMTCNDAEETDARPVIYRATVASVYISRKRGWNNDTRSRFFSSFFFCSPLSFRWKREIGAEKEREEVYVKRC